MSPLRNETGDHTGWLVAPLYLTSEAYLWRQARLRLTCARHKINVMMTKMKKSTKKKNIVWQPGDM